MPETNADIVETPYETLQRVAGWIASSKRVVVLTGAGISTDSGIPDFRGPDGLWRRDPRARQMATLQHYMADRDARVAAWRARLEHPAWSASPNAAHVALVELERRGKLDTLITQNIDGLHQSAGSSPEKVVEIHGTIREVMCMSCSRTGPMQGALERVRSGEDDPPCTSCGGILKSATVSFGQSVSPDLLERARRAVDSCDLLLALGTSLVVFPVAYLPQRALLAGARLVIMNAGVTRYDGRSHACVRAPLGRCLPEVLNLLGAAR
ncbi:MAG TPA: Sir2 family NAD-dependent protein deacetylase [Actinomycetota bacterium]|nr:Sir2 family NAD-dependent protein deacetylase [Actinomycetota bacterium]